MNFLLGVLIVVIIILITKNKDLKNQNNDLKVKSVNKINFCPKCGFDFRNAVNRINFCPKCGHDFRGSPELNSYQHINVNNSDIGTNVKKKHTDKEIKNSLILIIGSILVVIAAVVFLTSTWNITHNIVKTGIILFMLVVFLAISYVSDKYLNLKQTSKSFYYIALAYIPIILISISMFSLFGNYLSLYGTGRYIYLGVSSILVALIYYLDAKKKNNSLICIFSVIFQVLGVIFLTLIFTNDSSIVFIGLLIYSILISICYMINKIYFSEKIHLNLCSILCSSILLLLIPNNFLRSIFNSITMFDVLASMLLFINVYLVVIKIYNKDNIYKFIYPLLIMLIFNNVGYLFDNMMFRQALILASFAVIYVYNIIKENKVNIVTYIEILVSFSLFNIVWMISGELGVLVLDSYILYGIVTFLSLINYIYDDEHKVFSSSMLSIGVVIFAFSLIIKFDLTSTVLGYIALILILISMLLKNLNISLRNSLKWVGIVTLIFTTLINFNVSIWDIVLYGIYFLSTLIYSLRNKDDAYKIISYVYINVFLFALLTYTKLDYSEYIIPITTIIITLIERLFTNIRSKATDNYLVINFILSSIILNRIHSIYGFIFLLILNLIFVYYVIYYRKSRNNLLIPLLGMIPYLYLSDILIISNFNIMYIFSFVILTILCELIYLKKYNLYIVIFYIYSFFHITCLEEFKYLEILILIVGSFVCYLIKNNKVKDIYKFLLYLFSFILYNFVIIDLDISNITALNIGIYIIFTLLLTRTIFKKYGSGYKIWEYILCILINLIALGSYSSEYDGILYVIFLTIIVIVSYILRYGPVFLICLISILINVLLLTWSFWVNIPWWLYILIIGGVLIGFAIYNEAKDKSNTKDEYNNLKDHLDL